MLFGEVPKIEHDGQEVSGFKVTVPYPAKTAIVRLPNADEVAKHLTNFFGKVKKESERDQMQLKTSWQLFNKIKVAGDDLDEYEALIVVPELLAAKAVSTEKDGNEFTVKINTPFGNTVHVLRPMTFKERSQLNSAIKKDGFSMTPSVTLYDSLVQRTEGYAPTFNINDIPCNHKSLVISELIAAHDSLDLVQTDFDPLGN
jgi:hypothetical protein